MIRLFVALSLPEDLCVRIASLGGGIEGARWVAPENLHVTLRFIGDVQESVGEDLVAALDSVRAGPFPVTLSGTGHFGSGRKVHSLWVGVEKSPALEALHDRIDRAVVGAGLPPDARKYAPHVTVARLRGARTGRILDWLTDQGAFLAPPFEARAFTLFESRQGHYLPLADFPLS